MTLSKCAVSSAVPVQLARRAALGLMLAASMNAMAAAPAAPGGSAIARLGSVTVSQGELEQMLQSMPEAARAQFKGNRAAIEGWLADRLASESLLKEARDKRWADRPEVKRQIDVATHEIIGNSYLASLTQPPASYPSDAELRTAYEAGKSNFMLPPAYHVAQIYLLAPANDSAAVAKVRPQAVALAGQARSGDFAALARTQSQDQQSAPNGGDVGTMPLAQMLPEVRETVSKMQPGQVSEPVQSSGGFHIVKLLDTQAGRAATLDEIKPRLQQAMRQRRQQELAQSYMAKLAKPEAVNIDAAALEATLKKVN